ncbi:rCG27007, isoform CRA_a [Rattus norvegicus]|uniref:RCG27007, isoform CRA_a n=1 Tax=Rattus norvegicus TaxID=10116 RepID=A6HNW0_RAT|nr:rCG27007, isoform CRA_a [Rattus norvegicus]
MGPRTSSCQCQQSESRRHFPRSPEAGQVDHADCLHPQPGEPLWCAKIGAITFASLNPTDIPSRDILSLLTSENRFRRAGSQSFSIHSEIVSLSCNSFLKIETFHPSGKLRRCRYNVASRPQLLCCSFPTMMGCIPLNCK